LVVTFGEAKRHDEIDLHFAGHVTYVVGNCRRLRLRKLFGKLYASKA
jgi:hypothetical protein